MYKKGCLFICQITVLLCILARNDSFLGVSNRLNILKTKMDNVKELLSRNVQNENWSKRRIYKYIWSLLHTHACYT